MNERPPTWLEVEDYLEKFEAAWAQHGSVEVRAFLPPSTHPQYPFILRELLCVDMELGWHNQADPVAEYCRQFPELANDAVALAALKEQETRLRREGHSIACGEEASHRSLIATRVLGWRARAQASYEAYCHQREDLLNGVDHGSLEHADLVMALERDDPDTARMLSGVNARPKAGCDLLGFHLVKELGRGTFGQVFLAEQQGLANRLVALKIGHDLIGESLTLAQLQHSNIVPIHSAHREGAFQAVCMPYFGSTTLADVLATMRHHGGVPTVGNALWSTLHDRSNDQLTEKAPEPLTTETSPRPLPASLERLRHLSHVRAVLWIGARLADGLAHAHERGILHRDLKPANILLADDGTPMLLDFNLSQDVRLRGGVPALLGGTLPYMAPEHLEAFQGGERPVDARSDLYALGLMLYELLAGRHPFPSHSGKIREQVPKMIEDRRAGVTPLRGVTRTVPLAVAAIVQRCLHPDPERRYQSARELQEDAQCQLDDLPLRHTPEPSWRELAGKFLRRHPRLGWASIAATLALVVVTLGVLYRNLGKHSERVEADKTRLEHRDELRDTRILLGLPFPDPIELTEGEALCRRALARYDLPDGDDWEDRTQIAALPPADQETLREELGELLMLLARATWLKGFHIAAERDRSIAEAMRLNQRAERLIGSKDRRSLILQRAWFHRLSAQFPEWETLLKRGRELPLRTARDYYLVAGELASQGQVSEANQMLEQSTNLEPSNAAAWAARGACHFALGQQQPAVAAFTTCIALAPGFWRAYLWRGQAYLDLQDHLRAEADLDHLLRQRPGFVPALVYRGLARLGRKNYAGADADLSEAIKSANHTRLYFMRAHVRRQSGDTAGAERDMAEGLRLEPSDELSWVSRGVARLPKDPPGALADFDEALKLNRWSRSAAQNKAHVLSEFLNRPKDAIETLDAIIARYPDYTEARIGRGVLRARVGDRKFALWDATDALRVDTRPQILYQAGCIYALTSRQTPGDQFEAFRLLNRAIEGGFGADHVEKDNDLAALRGHEEFRHLIELARRRPLIP